MIAGSHSVGTYVLVANGAQGSGKPKRPPFRRKAPIFRCNHGLGSLTGRTPKTTPMDTTIVATVMGSHDRSSGALGASELVPVRAGGVDEPRLRSAGMPPVWMDMTSFGRRLPIDRTGDKSLTRRRGTRTNRLMSPLWGLAHAERDS